MSTAPVPSPLSVEAYLRGEENARRKHEFVEGVVYAIAGVTNAHNTIATNATVSLGMQLRGKSCRVFNSDVKVRVRLARGTRFYYPDAMVACQLNSAVDTFQDAPVVIVEVLSEATRRTDENEKRHAYLSIDSLCVFIRVEQSRAEASVDRRTGDGFKGEHYMEQDAVIPLPEIGCELKLSELFEGVEFVPEATDDDEIDS
jgi:Uma2 family endonuclease